MSVPAWLRSPWTLAALGAVGVSALAVLFSDVAQAAPSPSAPSSPKKASRIDTDPIRLETGVRYAGAIVTHRAANAASADQVRAAAEKRGWTDITLSAGKPLPGFPWTIGDADWYVVATYGGAPATQDRSEGNILGSAEVVDAFRAV